MATALDRKKVSKLPNIIPNDNPTTTAKSKQTIITQAPPHNPNNLPVIPPETPIPAPVTPPRVPSPVSVHQFPNTPPPRVMHAPPRVRNPDPRVNPIVPSLIPRAPFPKIWAPAPEHLWRPDLVANHIFDTNGRKQSIDDLIRGPMKTTWLKSTANELGRLAKGIPNRVRGTECIIFIPKSKVPNGKKVTYANMCWSIRLDLKSILKI